MPQIVLPALVSGVAAAIGGTSVIAAVASTAFVATVAHVTRPRLDAGAGLGASRVLLNREAPVAEGVLIFGRRRVGGVRVARDTGPIPGGAQNGRFGQIVVLAAHEIDGVEEIWLGETLVWTAAQWALDAALPELQRGQIASEFKGKFGLRVYTGSPDQAVNAAFAALSARWSDLSSGAAAVAAGQAARGRGIAYIYFQADWDADVFAGGIDQLPITALVRGAKVPDPRSGLTAWSDNPALILRHYLTLAPRFGGVGWTSEDLDEAAILDLADVCDVAVPLAGGGTQARWRFDGVIDTAAAPEANLGALAASWGGWWAIERGRLTVGGAAWSPAVMTITEDHLAGPIAGRRYPDYETRFNAVKARFADPSARYVPTDLPMLTSSLFAAEDGGEVIEDMGELSGQTSAPRARRMMKLALLKARRERIFTLPCTLAVDAVRIGDTVAITLARRGWDARTFEVTSRIDEVSPAGVRIVLGVVETSAAIFDETTSEEAPLPDQPAVRDIFRVPPAPGVPAITEALYATRDGTQAKVLAALSWAPSPYAFAHVYRVQARQVVAGVAAPWETLTDTPDTAFDVLDIPPGTWNFRVAAVTPRGRLSAWAQGAATIIGLGAVPAALQGVSVQSAGGLAVLKWAAAADLDVRIGGRIAIRHSPATSGATWSASRTIERAPGSATAAVVPLLPGSYLLRAEDSSGISGPVTVIGAQGATALSFANLDTLQEDDDFTGAKADVAAAAGILQLADPALAASGIYTFAAGLDLGAAKRIRLRADIAMVTVNLADAWLQRPGNWLGWADWLGLGDGQGDALIEARTTEDDPGGTPAWGPWARVDASEVLARGVQARAILTTTDASYTPAVSILRLQADEVA